MQREILSRLGAALFASFALAGAGTGASAQASLGMPFIGDSHLSFYSTGLSQDGVVGEMSTLYGGRYAHRFWSDNKAGSLSVSIQAAARGLSDGNDGIGDASITVAWTRRMTEVDDGLTLTAAVGANAVAWGFDEFDTGTAYLSTPFTAGVAYDIHVGAVTLSPFVAPSVAAYDHRTYVDDVRTSKATGWDARVTWGASLALKEVVLTTSGIRGETGMPRDNRWAFSAGISF
jgi:hypothetical protein